MEHQIIKAVTQYFSILVLSKERTAEMLMAKWAAVYLLKTETKLPLKAIAPLLGLGTANAAAVCFSRSLQEMNANSDLAFDIEKINEQIKQSNESTYVNTTMGIRNI